MWGGWGCFSVRVFQCVCVGGGGVLYSLLSDMYYTKPHLGLLTVTLLD